MTSADFLLITRSNILGLLLGAHRPLAKLEVFADLFQTLQTSSRRFPVSRGGVAPEPRAPPASRSSPGVSPTMGCEFGWVCFCVILGCLVQGEGAAHLDACEAHCHVCSALGHAVQTKDTMCRTGKRNQSGT